MVTDCMILTFFLDPFGDMFWVGAYRQLKSSCPNSLIAREIEQILGSMK